VIIKEVADELGRFVSLELVVRDYRSFPEVLT